jgi:hypothetical protein
MKYESKVEMPGPPPGEPSMATTLTGWVQQGVQSFFATQRILLDLVLRQNATAVNVLRENVDKTRETPTKLLTELAGQGMSNFISGQKVLLQLAQRQNEIMMTGIRDRVGGSATATAMTEIVRTGIDTFVRMQQDFLNVADKQTGAWLGTNKGFDGLTAAAREAMEHFVRAQKKYLDVIAEQTAAATNGTFADEDMKKGKKTELSHLARQATDAFIEAQKELLDLAGRQMHTNVKTASEAMDVLTTSPLVAWTQLTREAVKSYVDAQKALLDLMLKSPTVTRETTTVRKRPATRGRGRRRQALKVKTATVAT